MKDRIELIMKMIAAASLMGIVCVTGADVLGRGLFNTPLFGTEEIVAVFAVIAVGMSLPSTHTQRSHVGVELLYNRLPKGARKALSVIMNTVSAVLFGLVSWRMVDYAGKLQRSGQVSMNLELPTYYVVYMLGFSLAVFAFWLLLSAVHTLRTGEEV